jgi:aryl-alcohol dehydrogenase-like predicted oxidoreductase
LRRSHITLLQLHNSITHARGDQPTSLAVSDVFQSGGVLDAFHSLKQAGVVRHIGLTGLGDPECLREVIASGEFETVQTPYNLLNPSAGCSLTEPGNEANYDNQFAECARQQMGVLAIRVFAGGALVLQPPSEHTKKTPFFPLELYERDQQRARQLAAKLPGSMSLAEVALRFVISHANVSSAIVGFSVPGQVEHAVQFATRGPLSATELSQLGPLINDAPTQLG